MFVAIIVYFYFCFPGFTNKNSFGTFSSYRSLHLYQSVVCVRYVLYFNFALDVATATQGDAESEVSRWCWTQLQFQSLSSCPT